ncbi:MAG: hypothetical protein CL484_12650 [Acidobacteria bacterium]|nr:hypothetical protein [Acidobacteriota bacterium]
MTGLDLLIIVVYLTGTLWLGFSLTRKQLTIREYFTSGRQAPWGLIMFSIVATETSTVTIVSLPGFAFDNNLTFLQLVFGYLLGRLLISWLLLPSYFKGEYLTAYQILTERYGLGVRRLAAGIFLFTRNIADGFRLFSTGLVVAAALLTLPGATALAHSMFPTLSATTVLTIGSLLSLSVITIIYTSLGGMTAVLWTDFLHLVVYMGGTVLAGIALYNLIPGGLNEIIETGTASGRFQIFDFSFELNRNYTFWSGLVGGTCLTMATHGTDQLIVQRYLCSRTQADARKALLLSGFAVLVQFLLFLFIGVMLFVFYTDYSPNWLPSMSVKDSLPPDRVFPAFIVSQLPNGLRGLLVAAVIAAAMSTLSSSLNASASATIVDFYIPATRSTPKAQDYLKIAKRSTVVWGLVQLLVACAAIRFSQRVIDEVLGISSFTSGLILGMFLLTMSGSRRNLAAYTGIGSGALTMTWIRLFSDFSWQWYVLIGAVSTFLAGRFVEFIQTRLFSHEP